MKGRQIGFIAQDVEKVLPTTVLTQNDPERTRGLKYNEIVAVLTKAVEEQQAEIARLEKAVKDQQIELRRLQRQQQAKVATVEGQPAAVRADECIAVVARLQPR